MYWSGCNWRSVLPLPAPAEQTQHAKAGGEEWECGGQGNGWSLGLHRVRRQFAHDEVSIRVKTGAACRKAIRRIVDRVQEQASNWQGRVFCQPNGVHIDAKGRVNRAKGANNNLPRPQRCKRRAVQRGRTGNSKRCLSA
jgi:hypothetical protein